MTKSITRRMLVAGALVGSVLGSLASTQAADDFAVVTTSVESGFASVNPIAVRFTGGVNLAASSGTLVDRDGRVVTTVLGRTSSGSGPDNDSLVLTPNYGELDELRSPYTLTLNAVEAVLSGPADTEVVEREIWLDLKKGSAAITSPTDAGQPRVVAPGETLKIDGYAYDDYAYDTVAGKLKPRVGNRSGLASVEIKLYKLNPGVRSMGGANPGTPPTVSWGNTVPDVNQGTPPSVSPPVIQLSQEVPSLKHSATLSEPTRTTGAIEGEKTWTANVAGIGQGSWTLQAVAIDVAGNRSAAVETSFVIL